MDEGIERIRRLSAKAREEDALGHTDADVDAAWLDENRSMLGSLEASIPQRLRQLTDASNGDLIFEDSAFRSSTATAIRIAWRPGTRHSHAVELWLRRETGSVEWHWTMGHREPPSIRRVPASRFDLARLDEIVAALADPERWHGGNPPDV